VYRGGLLPFIYVVIGAFVAGTHDYFAHTGSVRAVGSALLAMRTGRYVWYPAALVENGRSLNLRS
jgi:carbon starvation protein CstA